MSKRASKIEIVNIGPVRNFYCEVHPGMNLLSGANGVGKSAVLNAIARAAGADVNVEVTDGQAQGVVKLDDAVLLTLTRSRAKVDGAVEVSLASVSPLGLLIDPGIKDRKAAEQARIKALLQLFDLRVTLEVIAELVEGDEAALDLIEEEIGLARFELDPVALAAKLTGSHGVLNKRKRELEKQAAEAHGRWQAARPGDKPSGVATASVAEAQVHYERKVGDYRQIQGEASQRASREEQIEQLKSAQAKRPNVESAAAESAAWERALAQETSAVARLESELAAAKERRHAAGTSYAQAVNRLGLTRKAEAQWLRNQELLDSEITGATEEVVETARQHVEIARNELAAARAREEYQQRLTAAEEARQARDRYTEIAARYEKLAKGVPARLGELLAQAGIKSGALALTVEGGVLQVIRPDGTQEAFHRLSAGQRTRIAMPLFIERNPSKLVSFPERFWNSLEAESKEEVAQILADFDCIGLTEVPTARGDELKVERFEVAGKDRHAQTSQLQERHKSS